MKNLVQKYLSRIEVREPQRFRNIEIFPVFADTNGKLEFLTLAEAFQRQLASVSEVSAAGSVPEVKVVNGGEVGTLLVEGEELLGARQHRMVATSALVAAKSEITVPVACTEAGRWSYREPTFVHSGHISPLMLRQLNSTAVAAALKRWLGHKSDQSAIWKMVGSILRKARVKSPTSALNDVFSARAEELNVCRQSLQPLPDQTGVIVLVNGQVQGLDIVSSPRAHRALHPELITSYALGALLEEETPGTERGREKVFSFLEEAGRVSESVYRAVGCGEDHRFEGGRIAGSALVADGSVIHLSLYCN